MSIYSEVKATGGWIGNHESDLYIEDNPANREILSKYPIELKNKRAFFCQETNSICFDIPFAYDPFWDANKRVYQLLTEI